MANWFKLYETDLDETRMRYALSKLAEVWPVWTGILMECCKHRNDSFSWDDGEQGLFGFSDRLKISIPKVNAAIQLLCEIKYIELSRGKCKVLKWNEKQDDYLARKSRGYWRNRSENKKVTVNHSESHIEERRGEEIRGEEKNTKAHKFAKPEQSEMETYALKLALPVLEISKFFDYYEANGWRVGRNPMKDWRAAMRNWKNNLQTYAYTNGSKISGRNTENPRNQGIIRGPTDYGAIAAAKQERKREAALARQMAENQSPPSAINGNGEQHL